jgi:AcrR family transcriptional regulator
MVASPIGKRRLSPTRIEHRERMRSEILAAARRLITRGGVDKLTMRTLGREVGVTAATLYGYFASKEAVLEALLEEKLNGMNAALQTAAGGYPAGAQRLFAFAMGYRRFAQANPDFYQMFIFKLDPPDWEKLERGSEGEERVLTALFNEVRTAIAQGEIHPLPVGRVCRMLWAVAHGYITLEANDCFGSLGDDLAARDWQYMDHVLLAARGFLSEEATGRIEKQIDLLIASSTRDGTTGATDGTDQRPN